MSLKILRAGILDTLQDLGRYGLQHLGINPGGAMDRLAMQVANCLTGNDLNETVLEMYFPAPEISFNEDAVIAITGADFSPVINHAPIPVLHPVLVKKGSVLKFEKLVKGNCCYLSVRGGLEAANWYGSYSTSLKAGRGGFQGRSLKKDDTLLLKESSGKIPLPADTDHLVLHWSAANEMTPEEPEVIYVLEGNEFETLDRDAVDKFMNDEFTISSQSDRMGYRLFGSDLDRTVDEELVSSPVSFGTIQLLPNGQLIILMADHQTTGGYPRIAHVAAVHHSKLAQKRAGDKIQFHFIDYISAENQFLNRLQELQLLQEACRLKLEERLYHDENKEFY